MTSSWLFNRVTTFSQTVTDNNNVFLSADTKSAHTLCTTERTFYFSDLQNFWLHAICACTEQHSTYQIRWENWWL